MPKYYVSQSKSESYSAEIEAKSMEEAEDKWMELSTDEMKVDLAEWDNDLIVELVE